MRDLLQQSLKPKRFRHSCAVFDEALKLADRFDADRDKVAVAALLHDCGREVPTPEGPQKAAELGLKPDRVVCSQPILAHPMLGAWYAEHKYGVTDPEVLDAIRPGTFPAWTNCAACAARTWTRPCCSRIRTRWNTCLRRTCSFILTRSPDTTSWPPNSRQRRNKPNDG